MKILIAGKPQLPKPEPIYGGTCPNCGCQIEVAWEEISVNPDTSEDSFCVECPTENCAHNISVFAQYPLV